MKTLFLSTAILATAFAGSSAQAGTYHENITPAMQKVCKPVTLRGLFGEQRRVWDCNSQSAVTGTTARFTPDSQGERGSQQGSTAATSASGTASATSSAGST